MRVHSWVQLEIIKRLTCPSKLKPPSLLGFPTVYLDHEENKRRKIISSTGGGRRHHGPGILQETPDQRTDFLSLTEQIRQHNSVGSSASERVGAREFATQADGSG